MFVLEIHAISSQGMPDRFLVYECESVWLLQWCEPKRTNKVKSEEISFQTIHHPFLPRLLDNNNNNIIVYVYNINKQTSCFFSALSNHKKMNIIIMKTLFSVSASIHLWTQTYYMSVSLLFVPKKKPAFQMMRIEKKNIILCKLNIILKWTEI